MLGLGKKMTIYKNKIKQNDQISMGRIKNINFCKVDQLGGFSGWKD